MSCNRILAGCLAAALAFACASCAGFGGQAQTSGEARYIDAVNSGIIAPLTDTSGDAVKTTSKLVEAVIGRLQGESTFVVTPYFPIQEPLYFENNGGRINGIYVTAGQMVKKGDLLAEIAFPQDDLRILRDQLLDEIRQAELSQVETESNMLVQMQNHRNSLKNGMTDIELEIHELQLQKLELDYQAFLRRNASALEKTYERLNEVLDMFGGEQLLAPYDGQINSVSRISSTATVNSWDPICSIINTGLVYLKLSRGSINLLQFGTELTVTFEEDVMAEEHFTFKARVVNDPLVKRPPMLPRQKFVDFYLEIIDEVDNAILLNRMNKFTVEVTQVDIDDVLIVPEGSLNEENGQYFVRIFDGDIFRKRWVEVGLKGNKSVQVLSGIEPGQLLEVK